MNGAAACAQPYQYFACGDLAAPQQAWFRASRRYGARRIVASYLAPYDDILFPWRRVRWRLRLERLPRGLRARIRRAAEPLYDYAPSAAPAPGHGWFRYAPGAFPASAEDLLRRLRGGRVVHGATIAGVAVQLAHVMGAAEIHLYGCSMDNDTGDNYALPGSTGRTTALQRDNFASLLDWLRTDGAAIIRHD